MRPSRIEISTEALIHNIHKIKALAPQQSIIAMVKANAYGCGVELVLPAIAPFVDAFGVACFEEAMTVQSVLCHPMPCVIFQGPFNPEELIYQADYPFQWVIHQPHHLDWIISTPLKHALKIWIKVNTGMNRLGFPVDAVPGVIDTLTKCPWVSPDLGLMTHFANADYPQNETNEAQFALFSTFNAITDIKKRSLANSAAIMGLPHTLGDVIRPGIMVYGVSPFPEKTGIQLGLKPVMRVLSSITAIQVYPVGVHLGYGGIWTATRPSRIALVPVGYGDGYPRHVLPNTPVWVNGHLIPIVGRISMDMMTIDLTDYPSVQLGDSVELWGENLPIETIAEQAGTIGYELLNQITSRLRR
jgi:alanine racemase